MTKEYENIKRYLLDNQWNIDWFEENFPDVKIPVFDMYYPEIIIFTDGYLFPVEFHDEISKYEIDSDRFYTLENEKFIKIQGNDVLLALDFIETQAEEIYGGAM